MAKFTVSDKAFRKDLKKVRKYLDRRFPKEVLGDFKKNTPKDICRAPAGALQISPKDTGNARRKTKLRTIFNGKMIVADYPYSKVLDKGEFPNPPKQGTGKTTNGYSTQAPKGMVEPTLDQAEDRLDRFLRRL